MPTTKKTETTKTTKTTKETSSVKVSKNTKKETQVTEPVAATVSAVPVDNVTENAQKKSVRKAGRTLLVKSASGSTISSSAFDGLVGLTSQSETKTSSSHFLTFDTITNAVNAFKKLRADSSDYKIKFSYYRVFFTVNGLYDSSDYNQVKQDLMNWVENKTQSTVLYCKLYRKESKYIGCGDFTIDTINGMNTLIAKEGGIKEFTIGTLGGTFYRYNGKRDKSEQQAQSADV